MIIRQIESLPAFHSFPPSVKLRSAGAASVSYFARFRRFSPSVELRLAEATSGSYNLATAHLSRFPSIFLGGSTVNKYGWHLVGLLSTQMAQNEFVPGSTHWRYSSARSYAGMTGPIDVCVEWQ